MDGSLNLPVVLHFNSPCYVTQKIRGTVVHGGTISSQLQYFRFINDPLRSASKIPENVYAVARERTTIVIIDVQSTKRLDSWRRKDFAACASRLYLQKCFFAYGLSKCFRRIKTLIDSSALCVINTS